MGQISTQQWLFMIREQDNYYRILKKKSQQQHCNKTKNIAVMITTYITKQLIKNNLQINDFGLLCWCVNSCQARSSASRINVNSTHFLCSMRSKGIKLCANLIICIVSKLFIRIYQLKTTADNFGIWIFIFTFNEFESLEKWIQQEQNEK